MLTLKLRIAPVVSALALAAVAFALPTQAATVAALQDGKTIAWIDTDKMAVTGSVALAGGASLSTNYVELGAQSVGVFGLSRTG